MRWIFRIAIILILLLPLYPVQAQNQDILIEFNPASLRLRNDGQPVQATLVVRNISNERIEKLDIRYLAVEGLVIEMPESGAAGLDGQSALTWEVLVRQEQRGSTSGAITFQLAFQRAGQGGGGRQDFRFASLAYSSNPYADPAKTMAFSTYSALTELNDFRPGYIYLEFKNLTAAPLVIQSVTVADYPDFIRLRSAPDAAALDAGLDELPLGMPAELPAGETLVLPVYVASEGQIRPGKHLLVFNTRFLQSINGEIQSGSLTARHEFNVRVFGEGEILGALTNVTSFLVLPGFLIVTMAVITWQLFATEESKSKYKFDVKTYADPRLLVVSITLSLIMAWLIYPAVSARITGMGARNTLSGYSFQDVFAIWLTSIVIGFGLALLAAGYTHISRAVRKAEEEKVQQLTIAETDEPMVVLDKLIRQGFEPSRLLEAARLPEKTRVYLLADDIKTQATVWAIPRVRVLFHEDADTTFDELQEIINHKETPLAEIYTKLKEGLADQEMKGIQAVTWNKTDGVQRPQQLAVNQLDLKTDRETIFMLELPQ